MEVIGAAKSLVQQSVDGALEGNSTVRRDRVPAHSSDIHIQEGRDVWYLREADYVETACPARAF
jgi:hypothetical protein